MLYTHAVFDTIVYISMYKGDSAQFRQILLAILHSVYNNYTLYYIA